MMCMTCQGRAINESQTGGRGAKRDRASFSIVHRKVKQIMSRIWLVSSWLNIGQSVKAHFLVHSLAVASYLGLSDLYVCLISCDPEVARVRELT